jgi:maltose alpha-D-glucosyltransferase/alpha-amylase
VPTSSAVSSRRTPASRSAPRPARDARDLSDPSDPGRSLGEIARALAGLDREAIAGERWFGAKRRTIGSIEVEDAFVLDGPGSHVLAVARFGLDDGSWQRYTFVLTGRPLRVAAGGDGAARALLAAIAEGRTIAALPREADGQVRALLVCRPSAALAGLVPAGSAALAAMHERALGADQSNSSAVLGESVLLKVYRRLEEGLNPELELIAFLTEEAGFGAVPPLGGFAEMVSADAGASTVAIAEAFVADGSDGYESIAESLTAWLLAPGSVSVEFATEVAADLGTLTAGLHAALGNAAGVPDFGPRAATRDELRAWARDARRQLSRATDAAPGEAGKLLRDLAPRIVSELTVFEALPSPPLLTRVHGDYHLGQVLIAPDGFRIVDFEGEPLRALEARRAHHSPLRDVASMLRSFDHVGRSAGRRAETRNGGRLDQPGLDLDGWLRRSRERFLDAYTAGLREAGSPIVVDPDLIRGFEIEKECYEFIYAATYLPSWLWAPTEGLRGLFA